MATVGCAAVFASPLGAAEPEPGLTDDTVAAPRLGESSHSEPVNQAPPTLVPPGVSRGAAKPTEEQSAEAPAPVVTPPRVLSYDVTYPDGATGSATVLLELVVARDGSVTVVDVIDGQEPFASAAARAALGWRFEPAQRDGQAVPSRIRFQLHYGLPGPSALPSRAAPSPGTPAQVSPGSPPSAAPAPSVQVTEVQVFGTSAPGSASISQAEVRLLAGAMGDPFRAISSLAGVGQVVTGLPVFFVRGAPPGNLGFLVDGVRVPLLFHAFLGPAVLHPRMIERIELHAGGYPASFGRFAGGVVSADLSQPRGELNAEWSARLVDAGVFLDVPFAGGKGNVMLGGRYSYTALILSLLSDLTLDYWDYQLLATYDLSPRDQIGVFAFGAYDYAATPPDAALLETPEDGQNAVLFHRIDLRYDRRLGQATKLRAALTLGTEGTRGGQGLVRDRLGGARLELGSQLSDALLLRAGASAQFDQYELELDPFTENFLDVLALFPSRTDGVIGAHADLVIDAAPGVSVTPGVRVDRYTSQGQVAFGVSPRLGRELPREPDGQRRARARGR